MLDDETRPARPSGGSASDRELAAGARVGDWIVESKLGGGGFGDVYQAAHATSRRVAALKVLHAHLVSTPEIIGRFGREIEVLMRLDHPNIVKILDAGVDREGRSYLAMELLAGADIAKVLAQRGRLSPQHALEVFEQLCEATQHAHAVGIVHRDLKASNVFLCDDNRRVVLLDFGIAKLTDALAPELTASHQTIGTPGCMAPEQIHGARADARTDVYALGGLLFHMLTGRLAFQDPSETMTQYLHVHGQRPRPSLIAPVPERIDDVVVRAMAVEPADRFADVRSLLAAARAALREAPSGAHPITGEYAAIFTSVVDTTAGNSFDDSLLADLEEVLPATERFLSERGFVLALDLGSSAVFVGPAHPREAVATVLAAWDALAQRGGRDTRVRIGMALHLGPATVLGNRVESNVLLRPETWGLPEPLEGVWVTPAIESGGRRFR